MGKIIAIILLALLILGGAFWGYQTLNKKPVITSSITANTTTATWKTYTDDAAGFSLKYPDTFLFNAETKGATKPVLLVSATKLSDIPEDLPMLMGRKDALAQKDLLSKGEGENLVKLDSLNGEVSDTLAQFEVCSVIVSRTLKFYPGDYRVMVSLVEPVKVVIASMPEFFTVDKANCGDNPMWDQAKNNSFLPTLAKGQGKGVAQEWYDDFNTIVKSVIISKATAPAPTPPTSTSLTYKNNVYGFQISYPSNFKALDSKNDLYGYPEGIVLIYSGGQAYDVVVEAWNSQAEYQTKYSSNLSDVTVLKIGEKYITAYDGTHNPENAAIIASFKLLSN